MNKSLREILEPVSKGDKAFVDLHKVDKKNDANGNGDDVFQATNVKKAKYPTQSKDTAFPTPTTTEEFVTDLVDFLAESETIELDEQTKEELRAMLNSHIKGAAVKKAVPGSKDDNLSATFRMAGKWMGRNLGNGATPSEKTYQKTWKKEFAKEDVNETYEDSREVTNEQYDKHHANCHKHLDEMKGLLDNHKKFGGHKWRVKDLDRQLEDIKEPFAEHVAELKPPKPSKKLRALYPKVA